MHNTQGERRISMGMLKGKNIYLFLTPIHPV